MSETPSDAAASGPEAPAGEADSSREATLARAREDYERREYQAAEAAARRVLESDPGNRDATLILASVLLAGESAFFAAAILENAAAKHPADSGIRATLVRALIAAGDLDAALRHADAGLEADPASSELQLERGRALGGVGRWDEALAAIERAVEARPNDPERHYWRANALVALGRPEPARDAFARARELDGRYVERHASQGGALHRAGQVDRAIEVYRWGLELQPGDAELMHRLTALGQLEVPDRAPDDYVASHFDRFAASFDERLVDRLEYRTPELILDQLRPLLGEAPVDVLDAGCGTGLCGPLLREHARVLDGVDLSPKMLDRARERGVYDELRVDELTADLRAHPDSYDAIVAADVLVYFGALEELLAEAAGALRPGGLLTLSIERAGDEDAFVLGQSGRYSHGPGYLRATAEAAGLTTVAGAAVTLRLEHDEPVAGLIATFRKPPKT